VNEFEPVSSGADMDHSEEAVGELIVASPATLTFRAEKGGDPLGAPSSPLASEAVAERDLSRIA
jgi:hypothetical protein